jgi:hypothetical protein
LGGGELEGGNELGWTAARLDYYIHLFVGGAGELNGGGLDDDELGSGLGGGGLGGGELEGDNELDWMAARLDYYIHLFLGSAGELNGGGLDDDELGSGLGGNEMGGDELGGSNELGWMAA